MKKILVLLLALLLAFSFAGCAAENTDGVQTETDAVESVIETNADDRVLKLGAGERSFNFEVWDADGNVMKYLVLTDEKTVGAALLALGVIAGDAGAYGLYVKTVDGITADYDTDGKYWAFYINGEYATVGVDSAEIDESATYKFAVEKG